MSHALPDDPRAPILVWRSSGGLREPGSEGPDLTIRADGSCAVGERFGGTGGVETRLSPRRVQELLNVAIDDARFFDIDAAEIDAQIEAVRRRRSKSEATVSMPLGPPYVDAGTTYIMVAADGRRHEVVVHGLSAAAREYREVEALARLRSIELHLLSLAEELAKTAP
jgi:hypothetical protein